MDPNLKENTSEHSDSDDWTLVSYKAPGSTSAASAPTTAPTTVGQATGVPTEPLEALGDDNLIEVDLDQSSESSDCSFERLNPEEQHGISNDSIVPGFHALDTTDDGEESQPDSRRSSVSRAEAVFSGSARNLSCCVRPDAPLISATPIIRRRLRRHEDELAGSSGADSEPETEERGLLYDDDSWRERAALDLYEAQVKSIVAKTFIGMLSVTIATLMFTTTYQFMTQLHAASKELGSDPAAHKLQLEFTRHSDNPDINIAPELYADLQALDEELSGCVKRQSPSSYKYYMSEDRFKEPESKLPTPSKHYNGLVCYGQETRWRERFNQLKEKKKFDLSRVMQEAKRAVANDLLGFYHPTLQFRLILNQLEYLEFLENKRNKKQSDETIKYLKVENMQLYRQLSNPSKARDSNQRLEKGLEWENIALRRELDALKARINIKAGPSYIKQSQELEQYERENLLLKKFLYDASKEVSVISKHFNLHTIDTPINLNDLEVLRFHTKTTMEYLSKLSTRVNDVLVENTGLKEELSENYRITTAVNKSLSPTFQEVDTQDNLLMKNNQSQALMKNSCIQNLLLLRKKAAILEAENKYFMNCCMKSSYQTYAPLVARRSSLNVTDKSTEQQEPTGIRKQIAALATGLEKRIRNAVALAGSRSFDELTLFLEEFGNRIRSTSLIPSQSLPAQQEVEASTVPSKPIDSTEDLKTISGISGEEVNFQPILDIHNSNHQMIADSEELSPQKSPGIRDSWFFKRANLRNKLRNEDCIDSKEYFQPPVFNDRVRREYMNLKNKKPNTKHTPVSSRTKHRKSKKGADKCRKMRGQKYSRSEL